MLPNRSNYFVLGTPDQAVGLSLPFLPSMQDENPPRLLRPRAAGRALAGQLLNAVARDVAIPFDLSTVNVRRPVEPPLPAVPLSFCNLPIELQQLLQQLTPRLGLVQQAEPMVQPEIITHPPIASAERIQLRNDLRTWVSAAVNDLESVERFEAALLIMSCFHNQAPELSINAAHITELPQCIGLLRHLKVLELSGCESLRSIPDVLDNINDLRRLDVANCQSLTTLPVSVLAVRGYGRVILRGSGINIAYPLGRDRNLLEPVGFPPAVVG